MDYVVATSVGHLSKSALLDLNRLEEGSNVANNPVMTLACYGRRPDLCLLATGDSRLAADRIAGMTDLAKAGLRKIFESLDTTVVRPSIEELAIAKNK